MYRIADPVPAAVQKSLAAYEPMVQQLLYRRGIETAEAAASFLNPSYDDHLHDPLQLHDIEAGVARILAAMIEDEPIVIYSDYDCDGIPGAVVLHDFFKKVGFENFTNYIPHRHYEGFGFSVEAVDKLAADKPALIITIDCGITDVAAVAHAKELGIDVIITDHHEPDEELPAAIALVNPKLGQYPFTELCGAAVVWKLVQALIMRGDFTIPPGWEKWWLDMVGVATIADMVPLLDENRVLAHYGLQVLRQSRRPGLQQLLRKVRAEQRYLTEDDIGFTIGPRINAASRMDTPEDAFHTLATADEAEAGKYVDHLEKLNNERKALVAVMTKDIHQRLKAVEEIPPVLVMGNSAWRPALVGLAANKLAEEYSRPVFLWGRDGNGVIKGSCRTGSDVSVVELMRGTPESFLEYGGHHGSGGFSVSESAIHTLGADLNQSYVDLGAAAKVQEEMVVDASLALDDLFALRRALAMLAPYGHSNPKPLFEFKAVVPDEVTVFGKAKDHTKLIFPTSQGTLEAIAFFRLPSSFQQEPVAGSALTLLAHFEESYFMGRHQSRLRVVEIF